MEGPEMRVGTRLGVRTSDSTLHTLLHCHPLLRAAKSLGSPGEPWNHTGSFGRRSVAPTWGRGAWRLHHVKVETH